MVTAVLVNFLTPYPEKRFPQGIDPLLVPSSINISSAKPRKSSDGIASCVDPIFDPNLACARVIQRIHDPEKLHIPLRIQRTQRLPNYFTVVGYQHHDPPPRSLS